MLDRQVESIDRSELHIMQYLGRFLLRHLGEEQIARLGALVLDLVLDLVLC